MNSFHFANTFWQERCDKRLDKLRKQYESKLDLCEKKIEEMRKPKQNSSSISKSYTEYKKKLEEDESPLSFGGGDKTHQTVEKQHYKNVEYQRHSKGHHTIRRVHIVGGRGHKSVTLQRGKLRRTVKKALTKSEIEKICKREFIPGLFNECMNKLQ